SVNVLVLAPTVAIRLKAPMPLLRSISKPVSFVLLSLQARSTWEGASDVATRLTGGAEGGSGSSVRVALCDWPPAEAVRVTTRGVVTNSVGMLKVAEDAPAGTVTL